jgi:ATP-dependent RNA helicase DDX60
MFYGLSMDRVQRLILSKLPSLQPNFPLTSTLTLRLVNLMEGSDQANCAVKAVRSILTLPQLSFGSNEVRHQLLHHFRFSIEYLRRANLLSEDGQPRNFFPFIAHLYVSYPLRVIF